MEKETNAGDRCPQDGLTLTPPKVCRANPNLLKIDLSKNGQFSPSSGCLLYLTPLGTGTTIINPGIYILSVACSKSIRDTKTCLRLLWLLTLTKDIKLETLDIKSSSLSQMFMRCQHRPYTQFQHQKYLTQIHFIKSIYFLRLFSYN